MEGTMRKIFLILTAIAWLGNASAEEWKKFSGPGLMFPIRRFFPSSLGPYKLFVLKYLKPSGRYLAP
jgi:hypothetical protein